MNAILTAMTEGLTEGTTVQERRTGRKGILKNNPPAEVAIVKWDDLPEVTWAEWQDIA